MDLKEAFPVKTVTVKDGVPVPLGETIWLLSYFNSMKAQLILQQETQRLMAAGIGKEDAAVAASLYVLVHVLVLGWDNLKEDGVLVEYSEKECARIFDTYEGLAMMVLNECGTIANFAEAEKKVNLGK